MIDAEHRELELLGHAPDEDHIPVPERHRPPSYHLTQTGDDLQVIERDNPASAWILCERGYMEVKQ